MAVELADLVESLQASLNVPGAARPMFDFTDEAPWVVALANGFWLAKRRGFYADYRVNPDGDQIVNTTDATIDMPREEQQIVVIMTALTTTRNLFASLFTGTRDKAGPVETERQRSSTLLRQLMQDLRDELEEIIAVVVGGNGATTARVLDAMLVRSGEPYFVN